MSARTFSLLLGTLLAAIAPLRAQNDAPALPARDTLVARVNAGVALLNQLYWSPTLCIWFDRTGDDVRGHYDGRVNPPWWSSANAVETLIDFMKVSGSAQYQPMLESLYDVQRDAKNKRPRMIAELKRRQQWSDADEQKFRQREADAEKKARERKPGEPPPAKSEYYVEFRNEYLDDSGWWGIAWLKMYDRTRVPKYLATARVIHAHMAKNWRPDKDGGVMWCEDEDKLRPNAITNSLFIILSARLYERTHEVAYLSWAEQTLAWFRAKALYDGIAVVDQPGHKGDYWTYNQGCYLGALTALYRATAKAEFLDEAVQAADTILTKSGVVLPSGVIVEKLGTNGWDPGLFKGVFARYLGQLRDVLNAVKLHPETAQQIDRVLRVSAASMLANSAGADSQYAIEWHAGAKDLTTRNFNTHLAALALLTATLPDARP